MAVNRYKRIKSPRAPLLLKAFFLLTFMLLLLISGCILNFYFFEVNITPRSSTASYSLETDNIMGLLLEADLEEFGEKFELKFDNITLPPAGFLVWNNNCHIPEVDIINKDILKVFHPLPLIECAYGQPFVNKTFDSVAGNYRLLMNFAVQNQFIGSDDAMSCCYKEVLRVEKEPESADKLIRLMPCMHFDHNFLVPHYIQYGILVECRSVARDQLVYMDAFFFVQKPRPMTNLSASAVKSVKLNHSSGEGNEAPANTSSVNTDNGHNDNKKNNTNYGLLLLGIDGLSQFNFRRTMPRTFTELKRHHWFELSGYNKIDDNTFPNLMALLTGYNLSRATEMCRPEEVGGLDHCDTAFKLFRKHGFKTAYAEDETEMSTFVYLRKGFQYPPTTFYLRPFMMAVEQNLPAKTQSNLKFCLGWHRAADYVFDFGLEFAERHKNERIFGLFWSNSFSHNYFLDPTTMDRPMYEYLKAFRRKGLLENNVVVMLSDHGARWGALRHMPQGFLEERLPMFFMWIPKSLQLRHPEIVHALKVNKHRLTSPYDIHMTLKHFLSLTTSTYEGYGASDHLAESCPACQTIFRAVPEERGCAEAGITEHWCTCTPFISISTTMEHVKDMAALVVDRINRYINMTMPTDACQRLELNTINEVNRRVENFRQRSNTYASYNEENVAGHEYQLRFYRILFQVSPNDAEFEVTVRYNSTTRSIEGLSVPSISRLNSYAKDSACLDEGNILKKFCICREEQTKEPEAR